MECDRGNLQGSAGRPEMIWREFSILLCLLWTGCGLIYENRYDTEHVTSYSNRNMDYLKEKSDFSEQVYRFYEVLFNEEPGHVTMLYDGEDGEEASADVLGYYLSPFKIVKIFSTSMAPKMPEDEELIQKWLDEKEEKAEELLHKVILHELAHHFLVNKYPGLADRCWLNEGLAGLVEEGEIGIEKATFTFWNSSLILVAKAAKKRGYDIMGVLDMSWSEFHDDNERSADYAAGYIICYYIVTQWLPEEIRFDHKVDIIHGMGEDVVASLEDEIYAFLDKLVLVTEVKDETKNTGNP